MEGCSTDNRTHVEIIHDLQGALAKDISERVGFDVSGYKVDLNAGDARHIDNRHGANGKADHSMADPNEYSNIVDMEQTYSDVELTNKSRKYKNADGTPAQQVLISIPKGNGTYYVCEAVPESKSKTIHIVSVYQTKEAVSQVPHANNSPRSYAQNEPASTTSDDNNVPQPPENSNNDAYWTAKKARDGDGSFFLRTVPNSSNSYLILR